MAVCRNEPAATGRWFELRFQKRSRQDEEAPFNLTFRARKHVAGWFENSLRRGQTIADGERSHFSHWHVYTLRLDLASVRKITGSEVGIFPFPVPIRYKDPKSSSFFEEVRSR